MSNRVLKMFEKMEKWNSISVPMKIQQFVYQTGQNNSSLFMNISGNWSTIFDTLWLSISKLIGIQDSLYETTESFNFIQYHQYYMISLSYGPNSKVSMSEANLLCRSNPKGHVNICQLPDVQEITSKTIKTFYPLRIDEPTLHICLELFFSVEHSHTSRDWPLQCPT